MRDRLDLGRLPDRLIRFEATLRVDEVRRKDGVDHRGLAETALACIPGQAFKGQHSEKGPPVDLFWAEGGLDYESRLRPAGASASR